MIEVYPLTLTQDEFKTAPERERIFYLKLGIIANEVSALNKLSLFSLTQIDDSELSNRAGSTLSMLALRLLAGRLYEAHAVITTGYNPLKLAYREAMKGDGEACYLKLNSYFSNPANFVKSIRHKLAFHTDSEAFQAGVDQMDSDEAIVDYMSQQRGNTLFWGAEAALISVLKYLAGSKDTIAVYSRLLDDTRMVAGLVNDFAYAFGLAFYHRNFPKKLQALADAKITIRDAPILTEFSLPWFFEAPSTGDISSRMDDDDVSCP
jgi:hypothetical protein